MPILYLVLAKPEIEMILEMWKSKFSIVCIVVGQLFSLFSTKLHQILHVAENCGPFHVCCFWEKTVIDIRV